MPHDLTTWLHTLGPWGPPVAYLLTILETAFTPLPVLALSLLNAVLFGPWVGFAITWSGSVTGAALVFWLARSGRRLSRWQPKGRLAQWEAQLSKSGFWAVFIGRLTALPSTAVNVAAGLSAVSWRAFLLGTALGKLPAVALYTFAGATLWRRGLVWVGVFGVAVLLLQWLWRRRRQGRATTE